MDSNIYGFFGLLKGATHKKPVLDDIPSSSSVDRRESDPRPTKKIALIIGNSDYQNPPLEKLEQSVNDAILVEKTMKRFGFDTTLLTNCKYDEMESAISKFKRRIKEGDIVFIYFTGHAGQQSQDNEQENYLFCVDAAYDHQNEMEGIKLNQDIIERIKKKRSINLIVIDACRVYPEEKQRFKNAGGGMTIDYKNLNDDQKVRILAPYVLPENIENMSLDVIYACEPGKFAEDGKFAKALCYSLLTEETWQDTFASLRKKVYAATSSRQRPQNSQSMAIDKIDLRKPVAQRQ